MLLATGFPVNRLRVLYLTEGLFIALTGSILGIIFSLLYTWLIIYGLSTAWQGAVAGMTLRYSASCASICTGFFTGVVIAIVSMIWTLNRQMKSSAHTLLTGNEIPLKNKEAAGKPGLTGWILPAILIIAAGVMIIMGLIRRERC